MTNVRLNDEEKVQIETLAADGQSLRKIGQVVGRSPHTVALHLEQPGVAEKVQSEKAELAEMYRDKARAIVESISDTDIAKASLQQKSISSGVLLDKSLLLSGDLPTLDIGALWLAVEAVRDMRDKAQSQLPAQPLIEGRI